MGREYDMTQTGLSLGIDIGSTTAKAVLVEDGRILYEKYQRHFSQVRQKTLELMITWQNEMRSGWERSTVSWAFP